MPFRRLIPLFLLIIFVTSLHAQVRRNAVPAEECQPSITGIPTITKVSPSTLIAGTTTMLTLTGTFPGDAVEPGCTYDEDWMLSSLTVDNPAGGVFDGPSDPNVSIAGMVPGSGSSASGTFTLTQITLTVTVAAGATPETDYIQVDCDGCIYTAIAPVKIVVCPLPANVSVNPNVWNAGQSYPITITGQNFVTTAAAATTNCPVSTVYVQTPTTSPDVTVAVSGISVVSATEITATVEATSAPYTGPALKGGTPAPAGAIAATVEVIATPPAQSGPAPAVAAKVVALDAPAAPTPNVDVLIAPQILWNDNVISGGAAAQPIVVGQQIILTTNVASIGAIPGLPVPLTITSNAWTTEGTTIGGYTPSTASSGPVEPTITTGTGLTTYWVYPPEGVTGDAEVTYSYCVSPGGCSSTATATFDVSGGGSMAVNPYNQLTEETLIACINGVPSPTGATGPYIAFGNLVGVSCEPTYPPSTLAMIFTPSGAPAGGNYSYVQFVNKYNVSDTLGTITPDSCTRTQGVDGAYPYQGIIPASSPSQAEDAPNNSLLSGYTGNFSFDATMFLLWTSALPNSIPVPIGYQEWGATGSAQQNSSGVWKVTTSQSPAPGLIGLYVASNASQTTDGYTQLQYGYPIWSGLPSHCSN